MLKITPDMRKSSSRLTVEGRLVGPWVRELEQSWQTLKQSGKGSFIVDLTGVTFIGNDGKVLLTRMWREGAELMATGCCTKPLVEQITGSRSSAPPDQRGGK